MNQTLSPGEAERARGRRRERGGHGHGPLAHLPGAALGVLSRYRDRVAHSTRKALEVRHVVEADTEVAVVGGDGHLRDGDVPGVGEGEPREQLWRERGGVEG